MKPRNKKLQRETQLSAYKEWPADQVTRVSVSTLFPYARNSRQHSPEQIRQIATSIKEFGWTMPVLIDETGMLIAGHGRIMAAKQIGLKEVPTMTAKGWSDEQKRAYVIADNKLTLIGEWDDSLLRQELADLKALDFDLSLTGFSSDELDALFALDEEEEPYTKALTPPIYTPSGEKWSPAQLLDRSKAIQLRNEIEAASDLPQDVAAFLRYAADRHIVFNFHRIADFYANASAAIQSLMERSGLVIIDYDSAIENGFVNLNEKLLAIVGMRELTDEAAE